jgi:hypothetical protein
MLKQFRLSGSSPTGTNDRFAIAKFRNGIQCKRFTNTPADPGALGQRLPKANRGSGAFGKRFAISQLADEGIINPLAKTIAATWARRKRFSGIRCYPESRTAGAKDVAGEEGVPDRLPGLPVVAPG